MSVQRPKFHQALPTLLYEQRQRPFARPFRIIQLAFHLGDRFCQDMDFAFCRPNRVV